LPHLKKLDISQPHGAKPCGLFHALQVADSGCRQGIRGMRTAWFGTPDLSEQSTMATQSVESLALRPREAAKALGISARTLWGLTAPRGPIPCLRIGHGKRQTVLYPVAELQAWMSQQAEAEKGGDHDNAG
jgi:predicted DNA-binding transcriptional regulator AlpA